MKKLISLILILVLVAITYVIHADYSHEDIAPTCAQDNVNTKEQIELTNKSIEGKTFNDTLQVLKIPMVFHVYYYTQYNQDGDSIGLDGDVSIYQIHSAIHELNQTYDGTYGTKETGVDWNIEFYLMNMFEGERFDGIIYHNIDTVPWLTASEREEFRTQGASASTSSGLSYVQFAPDTRINDEEILNYHIVTEFDNNNGGGGVQGYAYIGNNGIVQVDNATGTYRIGAYDLDNNEELSSNETALRFLKTYTNKNATTSHEVGHNIGLFHTFQSTNDCDEGSCNIQGDRVCDTPPTVIEQSCSNFTCPDAPNDNYMGYTSENCKTKFTAGQRDRGRLVLAQGSRSGYDEHFDEYYEDRLTDIVLDINLPATQCENGNDVNIKIRNVGDETLANVKLIYGSSYEEADTIDLIMSVLPFTYANFVLPNQGVSKKNFGVQVIEINNIEVDLAAQIEQAPIGSITIGIETTLDVLGGQNYWELIRLSDDSLIATAGPFPNFQSGTTVISEFCINPACYKFVFYDIVGNGFQSNGSGIPAGVKIIKDGVEYASLPVDFLDEWEISNCPNQLVFETKDEIVEYYNMDGVKLNEKPLGITHIILYPRTGFSYKELRKPN